jgi:membrane dipeptidase
MQTNPMKSAAADQGALPGSVAMVPSPVDDRISRILADAIVILAHDHFLPPADVAALRAGGVTTKVLLGFVDARLWADDPEKYRESLADEGWAFDEARSYCVDVARCAQSSPDYAIIRCAEDMVDAKRQNRIGLLLGAEGAKYIERRIENLRTVFELGMRHTLLTWAFNNHVSASESDTTGAGLTEFGREVVLEMNRLGMVIDTTHLSRAAMADVLALSTRPVLNSHTSLKTIAHRVPSLTEEEIRRLAERGGVLGLHFMTHMLTGRFSPPALLEEVVRQIDAIVNLGGIDCVALGPDFLPNNDAFRRNTGQANLSFPVGLESPAGLPCLVAALLDHGYAEDAIQKILGGNLLRLFRETLPGRRAIG